MWIQSGPTSEYSGRMVGYEEKATNEGCSGGGELEGLVEGKYGGVGWEGQRVGEVGSSGVGDGESNSRSPL